MTFGDRLKQLREEKKLTQEQLGSLLNLSKANISRYEKNIHQPSFETLEFLCEYFDVSINYILGKTENRKENLDIQIHGLDKLSKDEIQFLIDFFSAPENKGYLELDVQAKKNGVTAEMLLSFVKGFQFGQNK